MLIAQYLQQTKKNIMQTEIMLFLFNIKTFEISLASAFPSRCCSSLSIKPLNDKKNSSKKQTFLSSELPEFY
jgi:hypothetical protein